MGGLDTTSGIQELSKGRMAENNEAYTKIMEGIKGDCERGND